MRVLSVSEMRALESTADMAGHSYAQMMALAGKGVAEAITDRFQVSGKEILVLVGPGNNGGDGLIAAGILNQAGAHVTAYLAKERVAEQNKPLSQAQDKGVAVLLASEDQKSSKLLAATARADIIIDALLGTGATLPLRGTVADVLNNVQSGLQLTKKHRLITLNAAPPREEPKPFIVSVDGPSGLDFNSGAASPLTLKAHLSVTFAAPKSGHFQFPGAGYVGELVVADINIPATFDIPGEGLCVATPENISKELPQRPANAHKGTFGKAMIVAGSTAYTGAAILAAKAAVRGGAGLVTLAMPASLHGAAAAALQEATHLPLPHSMGRLDAPGVSVLLEKLEGYTALLIGPGLSNTAETKAFMRCLLGQASRKRSPGLIPTNVDIPVHDPHQLLPPLVIDADGLNILSEIDNWPSIIPAGSILSPHPGEMARLTGKKKEEIQANRWEIAREYARKWGHVVVLKGAFTIVAAPTGKAALIPFANAGLSTAGTGDVLAGIITALRAQGLEAFKAAVCGAYLHALAGELAKQALSAAGMAASDLITTLPEAWKRLA